MTREESKKFIKSKMCDDCSIYLGGGKCSNNCKVIEAIKALEELSISTELAKASRAVAMAKKLFETLAPDQKVMFKDIVSFIMESSLKIIRETNPDEDLDISVCLGELSKSIKDLEDFI